MENKKEYRVKSGYCPGRKKVYKSGDIVTSDHIEAPEEKVTTGHLIVWDDEAKKAEKERLEKSASRNKKADDDLKKNK